eukprot:gene12751-12848_t
MAGPGARVWVLASLGRRWTTRIIILPGAPLVTAGPYRYFSHPNYAVVVGEIAVLPLCLGLPWAALVFSIANALILTIRIRAEHQGLRSKGSAFFSLTQTPKEVSLVCDAALVPPEMLGEKDWRCLEVDGVLDFSLVGILSELSSILAAEQISIFVISTYDTDYILVREQRLNQAIHALKQAGHAFIKGETSMKKLFTIVCLALSLSGATHVYAQDRMPAIAPDKYDDAQKKSAAEFLEARKVPVFGPFEPLMRSPELMSTARAMGDYLRYKPAIGTMLSEFVILVTARQWSQDYEWHVHAPIALKQGVTKDIVDALADGRRPTGMSEDEEICYDFSTELHHNKRVSDATYERALKRFGEKGIMDMVGINGYYTLLAMALNTSRYPVPPNGLKLRRHLAQINVTLVNVLHHDRVQTAISPIRAKFMSNFVTSAQLEDHIASIRENIRDLTEQAAARSGASDESRADALIAAQEAELQRLIALREKFKK